MSATLAQFRTRFPEMSAISNDIISMYIADAIADVSSAMFQDLSRAQLCYAAHLVATRPTSIGEAPSRVITSRSVGAVSVSFAADGGPPGDSELGATKYGAEFLRIRNADFSGFCVV